MKAEAFFLAGIATQIAFSNPRLSESTDPYFMLYGPVISFAAISVFAMGVSLSWWRRIGRS